MLVDPRRSQQNAGLQHAVFKKCANPFLFLFIFVDESIDGVLETRTQGGRMEGADKSTEQWWHPSSNRKYPDLRQA